MKYWDISNNFSQMMNCYSWIKNIAVSPVEPGDVELWMIKLKLDVQELNLSFSWNVSVTTKFKEIVIFYIILL